MLRPLAALVLSLVTGLAAGCHSAADCASLGDPSGIASRAARLELAIYPLSAGCAGDQVANKTIAPIKEHDFFTVGAPLALDVGAGAVVVHLTAFADVGGTQPIGEGCATTVVAHNTSACLALTLNPVGGVVDAAMPTADLTGVDQAGADFSTPDLCIPTQHSSGLSQWTDCAPRITMPDDVSATAMCKREGGVGCQKNNCSGGNSGSAICGKVNTNCVCWTYSGGHPGSVGQSGNGNCVCGDGSVPWF